jgi:hypothetical protein
MLIIPKTTGEPEAALGVPRTDDDDEPELAAVVLELAADELVLDFDELPQATVPTAVRAHTPTRAARLLTCDVIMLLSPSSRSAPGVRSFPLGAHRARQGQRVYAVWQSVCKFAFD